MPSAPCAPASPSGRCPAVARAMPEPTTTPSWQPSARPAGGAASTRTTSWSTTTAASSIPDGGMLDACRGPAVQVPGSRPNRAKKGPLRKSDHRIVQNVAPRGLPRPGKTRDYPPSRAFMAENVSPYVALYLLETSADGTMLSLSIFSTDSYILPLFIISRLRRSFWTAP